MVARTCVFVTADHATGGTLAGFSFSTAHQSIEDPAVHQSPVDGIPYVTVNASVRTCCFPCRPERWLEMDSMPSAYSYNTFNAGPRLCLGQRLAELEGVYVLAGLLSRFKFTLAVPGQKVTYAHSLSMPMAGGLFVVASSRETQL